MLLDIKKLYSTLIFTLYTLIYKFAHFGVKYNANNNFTKSNTFNTNPFISRY